MFLITPEELIKTKTNINKNNKKTHKQHTKPYIKPYKTL